MKALLRRVQAVSLKVKILTPVALLLALASLVLSITVFEVLDKQLIQTGSVAAGTIAETAERGLKQAMLTGHSDNIGSVMRDISDTRNLPRLALRRLDGSYVVDTNKDDQELRRTIMQPKPGELAFDSFTTSSGSYRRVTKAVANHKQCYGCHSPNLKTIGYLEADVSIGWLQKHNQASRTTIMVITILTLVVMWVMLSGVVNMTVIRPLGKMAGAMKVVREGERNVQVSSVADDEMGRLAESFNAMVQEVAVAEDALLEKEHQLAKAEKLAGIGMMAAGIAHEINNPLAAVLVASEALNTEGLNEEQRNRLLNSLIEGSRRIQGIVSELLTLDSRQGLNIQAYTAAEVVRKALHSINVPETIRVRFQIGEALPKISVDSHKIARALGNIMKNAVQAMPDGGELRLSAEPARGYMQIRISDTGQGMEESVREHIFDPFFSTREVGKGFGLGLAMAHGAVAQHGGEIEVESTIGLGTTFFIYLPMAPEDVT